MLCVLCGNECDGAMKDGHDNVFCSDVCYYAYHGSKQLELPLQGDPADETTYDPLNADLRLDLE